MNPSENPYASSHQESGVPVAKQPINKPVSVIVFGILNLVFGVPGLLFNPFNLLLIGTIESGDYPPNPVWDIMRETPGYMAFYKGSIILGMVMSAVLIAAGIGLLMGRSWGRSLTIIHCWIAILFSICGAIASFYFLWEPLNSLQGPEGAAARVGGIGGGIAGALCGPIYPIITLIFMYRRVVVDYFRQQQDY